MIIWRGWGILAFLAIGLGVGITALLAAVSGTNMDGVTWQGIPAFLIAGTGVYFLGIHLNVTKPTRDYEAWRSAHFASETTPTGAIGVASGSVSFDQPPPLSDEERKVLRKMKNRHSLFFIPLQWWGIILPLLGLGITLGSQ